MRECSAYTDLRRLGGQAVFWAVVLALVTVLGLSTVSMAKSIPGMDKKSGSSKKEEVSIPQAMSPQEMQAFMATLSDEQVRRVLLDELKRQAQAELAAKQADAAGGRPHKGSVQVMEHQAQDLQEALGVLGTGAAGLGGQVGMALERLTEGQGVGRLFLMVLMVAVLYLSGLIGEVIWRRLTARWQRNFTSGEISGAWSLLARVFQLGVREALAVIIYLGTVVLFFMIFIPKAGMLHLMAVLFFFPLVLGRAMGFLTNTFLAPHQPSLRLISMNDSDARWLRAWLVFFIVWVTTLNQICFVLKRLGISDDTFLFLYSLHSILGVAVLIVMALAGRRRVDMAFSADPGEADPQPKPRILKVWHYLAILYLLVIEFLWQAHFLLTGEDYIWPYLASLLSPFILILVDRALARLTLATSALRREDPAKRLPRPGEVDDRMDGETKEEAAEAAAETSQAQVDALERLAVVAQKSRPQVLLPALRRVLRIVLTVSLVVWLMHLWGAQLPWGGAVMRAVMNVLLTVFIAVMAWEFISSMIDRRLNPQGGGHGHGEGEGGAGGDRFQTILSLARKALAAVVFIFTAMIILSSLGVDIGPLIAGAGVFGLAIGFGAQTLVRDIMSGIFFMIDDAFRIGDYVVAGGSMGTVEKLSIRSITLRHHLGMVQIIPYGQLKSVTNNSRDWIITKLKFKVPYGTDVKLVKKIVKKLNKRLMADEEWGPVLLAPLKSQGVKKLEDSAMVMAVKFMTRPGEQFMLKRLILDQIQKAFDKAGIQFAHRKVSVELPQEPSGPAQKEAGEQAEGENKAAEDQKTAKTDPNLMAGAAAMAILVEEEEQAAAEAEKGKKKK